jgi:Domain of unknown function (DUF397)
MDHDRAGEGLSAADWRRSSASTANGNCVEVAYLPDGQAAVRDSKDKTGPMLRFGQDEWQGFLDGIRGTRSREP